MHYRRLTESPKSSSARRTAGAAFVVAALVLLGACREPTRRTAGAAAPAVAALPGGRHLVIDPARSELRVLVYRGGALARFGHNHVLVSKSVAGDVWVGANDTGARFELALPVASFVIDEPTARLEEGADFAIQPSAVDVEGTRHNLLGPRVLDADGFPEIRVIGAEASAATGASVTARFRVRSRETEFAVPVTITRSGEELAVAGGFTVLQSALGLEPFSVALGALQVRDDLAVRFRLVARVPAGS